MTTTQTTVKMLLDRWQGSITNINKLLGELSDTQLEKEIAPGKNRGVYLLGHLIAVHDDMLVLMDMGEKLYPELKDIFISAPDKAVAQIPSVTVLRSYWSKQCDHMHEQFMSLSAEDWFAKHTAVSAEDFSKEPHRNKLNILLTRTTHLAYHTGQLILLKQ